MGGLLLLPLTERQEFGECKMEFVVDGLGNCLEHDKSLLYEH